MPIDIIDVTCRQQCVRGHRSSSNTEEIACTRQVTIILLSLCPVRASSLTLSTCLLSSDGSRCAEEKLRAMRAGNESGIPIFVPSCDEEGGYRAVQCHEGTGYCWCVDAGGRPVGGSSVRHSRPLCDLLHVRGRWRRGKHRTRDRGRQRKRDICTQADR